MDASIRQLKANLSGLIRRVAAGETVTVRVRNRRVARIVPIAERRADDHPGCTPPAIPSRMVVKPFRRNRHEGNHTSSPVAARS